MEVKIFEEKESAVEVKIFTDKLACQLDADQFNFKVNAWIEANVEEMVERKIQFFDSSRPNLGQPSIKGLGRKNYPVEPCVQCMIALFYRPRLNA